MVMVEVGDETDKSNESDGSNENYRGGDCNADGNHGDDSDDGDSDDGWTSIRNDGSSELNFYLRLLQTFALNNTPPPPQIATGVNY